MRFDIRTVLNDEKSFTDGERLLAEWYATDQRQWQAGGFTMALFDAMAKADGNNLERLRTGFPSEVSAWHEWAFGNLWKRFEEVK